MSEEKITEEETISFDLSTYKSKLILLLSILLVTNILFSLFFGNFNAMGGIAILAFMMASLYLDLPGTWNLIMILGGVSLAINIVMLKLFGPWSLIDISIVSLVLFLAYKGKQEFYENVQRKKGEVKTAEEKVKTAEEKKEETTDEDEVSFDALKDFYSKNKKMVQTVAVFGILFLIMAFAFNSRIQNVSQLDSKYLISPDDPYVFYRYANYIADNGSIMANDTMRNYPLGFDTKVENMFAAVIAGHSLRIARTVNPELNMFDVGAWFAPILLLIAIPLFFLMTKEVFNDDKIALMATGIFAFSQAILFRTMAGFLEKEPLFLPLMFLTIIFFLKAYKKDNKMLYVYAGLAGVFTGLSAYTSGLFLFMQLYIVGFFAAEAILGKLNKNKFWVYLIWFVVSSISIVALTIKYGRLDFYKSLQFQLPAISLVIGAVSVFIKKPKNLKILPKGIFDVMIAAVILIVAGAFLLGPVGVWDKIGGFANMFQNPMGTNRFVLSVSENQPPVFYNPGGGSDWWHTFGLFFRNPITGKAIGFGITFLLFFSGSILLFYKNFKKVQWGKYVSVIFLILMCALVFENFSYVRGWQWVDVLFGPQWLYLGLFAGSIILLMTMKEKFEEIDSIHLFLIVWFVISVIGANGAVRLFFVLVIPAAILAAYFLNESSGYLKKLHEVMGYLPYVLAGVIIIASAFTATAASASFAPRLQEWYGAMDWVKTSTPEDSVFTHWWDYGYLMQAMGERTTVVDPGNFNVTRNYHVGGMLFNAFNTSESVSYLDDTNPDYWLICSEDVLKFYQIARLGSLHPGAEGRESFFTLYSSAMVDYQKQTVSQQIVPNNMPKISGYSSLIVFDGITGQTPVMENFRIGNKLYSGEHTFIARYFMGINNESIGEPHALVYDAVTGSTDVLPVRCACEKGVGCADIAGEESVPVCVLFTEHYIPFAGIVSIPYKAKDVLFTQLYLLDREIPGFEKVFDNNRTLDIDTLRGFGTNVRIYKFDYELLNSNIEQEGW